VSVRVESDVRIARSRTLGLAGSGLLAVATTATGALPVRDPFQYVPVISQLRSASWLAMGLTFLGLTLLVGAWLRLGAVLREDAAARRPRTPVREMTTTMAWWTAPLLLVPPLYSRDIYSYLVQGTMFAENIDPYRIPPVVYGADNISEVWQHSTAPYGPVFLAVAAVVSLLAQYGVIGGILLMRLVNVGALVVIAYCMVPLARRYGIDPARALWLGLLNPLVLAHVVGGVHNDAMMIALMVAGLLMAQRDRPVLGALLVGLAVLVKAPAGLALVFMVPAAARWLTSRGLSGSTNPLARRALVRGAALMGAVGAGTIAAVTAAADSGYGWIAGMGDTVKVYNGLSVATDVGRLYDWIASQLGVTPPLNLITAARLVGLMAAGVVVLVLLRRMRGRPVLGVGLGLGVVVMAGPVIHPWYLLWAIVPIAAATRNERLIKVVAGLSVAMMYYPMPSGGGPTGDVAVGVVGVVIGVIWLRRNPIPGIAPAPPLLGTARGAVGAVRGWWERLAAPEQAEPAVDVRRPEPARR